MLLARNCYDLAYIIAEAVRQSQHPRLSGMTIGREETEFTVYRGYFEKTQLKVPIVVVDGPTPRTTTFFVSLVKRYL